MGWGHPSHFVGPSPGKRPPLAPGKAMSAAMETTGAFAANEQQSRIPNSEVWVLIRANQRTYELRERLRAVGMRWLAYSRVWSGMVPESMVTQMETEGLQPLVLVPEGHPLGRVWGTDEATPTPAQSVPVRKPRNQPRREALIRVSAEERVEAFLPEHGWALQDITANLSDDDRAEDERRVERHLRDLRARVKAVRALISADVGIAQTLATCPEKAVAFYAIHGVTESQVKHGVPDVDVGGMEWEDLAELLGGHFPAASTSGDWVAEEAERAAATLPGSEAQA